MPLWQEEQAGPFQDHLPPSHRDGDLFISSFHAIVDPLYTALASYCSMLLFSALLSCLAGYHVPFLVDRLIPFHPSRKVFRWL